MHIEINDRTLTGKLENIAHKYGVSIEKLAIDLLNVALAEEATVEKLKAYAFYQREPSRSTSLYD